VGDNQQVEQTLSINLAVATNELARLPPMWRCSRSKRCLMHPKSKLMTSRTQLHLF
jgi:hypothetical protein